MSHLNLIDIQFLWVVAYKIFTPQVLAPQQFTISLLTHIQRESSTVGQLSFENLLCQLSDLHWQSVLLPCISHTVLKPKIMSKK